MGDNKVGDLVIRDIVASMLQVAGDDPIRNDGSYPMKILWEIYEAAADYLKNFEEVMALNDSEVELIFQHCFPVFLRDYPAVMELDGQGASDQLSYAEQEREVMIAHCPAIDPCPTCGYPKADGWICGKCGDDSE